MIDGVRQAEVLLFSVFFSIHIRLQCESAKAVEAVKHRHAHTPQQRMSGQTK